jgi:signal transduction histidine kinase
VLDVTPMLFGNTAEIEARYPAMASNFVQSGTMAFVAIPVGSGGRALGGLSFSFAREQHFDEGERTFLLTLGEQAAQALERARLLEAEQRLRERAEILADAGAALTQSLDLERTLDALVRLVVPRVADWCFVELLTEDGRIVPAAIHHLDPERVALARSVLAKYPIDPDAPFGTAEVLRTGIATLAPEIPPGAFEAVAQDEEHLATLNAMGFRSHLSLPLQVRGRTFGVLSLVTAESGRRYGPEDLAFGEDLARRVAVAVDNAQLYHAERYAREAAEGANRAKSEFLSIMSHELRTPLNAVGGYAELIEMGIHGPVTEAQRDALVRIQRSQRHLLGLINEVLNYARVDAGQVVYSLEDVAVADAVGASEALVAPQIQAKELVYEFGGCDPALAVHADADKLQQILLNLLGNAIKFTRPGGRITLSCAAVEHAVAITV